MNKKRWLIGLVLLGILMQFLCVGGMIVQKERVLRNGTLHRFKVQPVDPWDLMRGRYVTLSFPDANAVKSDKEYDGSEWVYVRLKKNDEGFSAFDTVTRDRPEELSDTIRLRVYYCSGDYVYVTNRIEKSANGDGKDANPVVRRESGTYTVHLKTPFSRFYMDEDAAPEAERLVNRQNERDRKPAVACVRVLNGQAVLADLEIDGQPITAWLKANGEKETRSEPAPER
ncbi:MAG: GDYXXLXY domain-containing protein [Kiritimatiellae bacterium]|nr:GDYXXLXY domain-containing protein [Kiritimatiellia bacterium]MBP5226162.1 GDYXXLXY domain-containing protein [Kiritimatiellia bacterium]